VRRNALFKCIAIVAALGFILWAEFFGGNRYTTVSLSELSIWMLFGTFVGTSLITFPVGFPDRDGLPRRGSARYKYSNQMGSLRGRIIRCLTNAILGTWMLFSLLNVLAQRLDGFEVSVKAQVAQVAESPRLRMRCRSYVDLKLPDDRRASVCYWYRGSPPLTASNLVLAQDQFVLVKLQQNDFGVAVRAIESSVLR
jgi:hypothetical protein